jgi:hypothetical protein
VALVAALEEWERWVEQEVDVVGCDVDYLVCVVDLDDWDSFVHKAD